MRTLIQITRAQLGNLAVYGHGETLRLSAGAGGADLLVKHWQPTILCRRLPHTVHH
jgi:hypothetical protein